MVTLLKGLLGKTSRPIVVCGKLLCDDRLPVVACLENFHVKFRTANRSREWLESEGNQMIKARLQEFNDKYGEFLPAYVRGDPGEVSAVVDTFTGAILIENKTYQECLKENLHEVTTQLSLDQRRLLTEFMKDYIGWYYELYVNLFHRRITAQHLPINIRCHFVKGLFMPVIVETEYIRSPLVYSEHYWLYEKLHGIESVLERKGDGIRRLGLSAAAFCDIAPAFNAKIVREMDRRNWMFILCDAMLAMMDEERAGDLAKRYNRTLQLILDDDDQHLLFACITQYGNKAKTGLRRI